MTSARKRKSSRSGAGFVAVALLALLVPEAPGIGCPHHGTHRATHLGEHASDHEARSPQHGGERSDSFVPCFPCADAGRNTASPVLSAAVPAAAQTLAPSSAGYSCASCFKDAPAATRLPYVLPFSNAPPFSDPSEAI